MLLIVGNRGGTNVGESLVRSAIMLGIGVSLFDARGGRSPFRIVNALLWRFGDKRPAKMRLFGQRLLERATNDRAKALITTGLNPVSGRVIRALRSQGLVCMHYSTDDPWNPTQRANWFLRSLPEYNIIFSTRQSNIDDFLTLGCKEVRYLPFAYDEFIFGSGNGDSARVDAQVLFAGGADRDRVDFIETLLARQIPISLVGGYWEQYPSVRRHALGYMTPEELGALTQAAKVNLCLVRRANRDGHVMRSFEIAALGGCMVVEDTAEHRDIFGAEGECVLYFSSPDEAANKIRQLLADPRERFRLGQAVRSRIVGGANTYTDRLRMMMAAGSEILRLTGHSPLI
ncbi:MAG: glycosyltransferase [Proteobacteria bacterium]|nr:glycosyltransferase [Pseudomonadota bacterium]